VARIIDREELPHSGTAYKFEGKSYGGADISFFLSDTPPGKGPSLHTHPYDEVFVIQEGTLTFRVGDAILEAKEGQIVIAQAGTPHGFINSGTGRSRHVDIHTSGRMITTWLEE
jgi:quercetin dioxygenase-like cupin family protein